MKRKRVKLNVRSAHYHKQSIYQGSNREVRSNILRRLLTKSPLSIERIIEEVHGNPMQIKKIVESLQNEGFLIVDKNIVSIV